MRLVKGTFTGNLPSTLGRVLYHYTVFNIQLGVDFHVKGLHVDEKNIAVQLWDTAGD